MERLFVIVAVFAALFAASEVKAQGVSPATRPDPDVERRLEALNNFSKCLATRRIDLADEILALPLESSEQHAAIREMLKILRGQLIIDDSCLRARSMTIKYLPALLGGMAEARLLANNSLRDTNLLSRAAREVVGRNAAERFALCLVGQRSEAAARLIRSNPVSAKARSAARELRSDLAACPFGTTAFPGDDFALRTYAAVGLYLATNPANSAK